MNIEKGDLFVVTRGHEFGSFNPFSFLFNVPGDEWKRDSQPTHAERRYDRSWNGCVFEAMEVCDNVTACRILFAPTYKRDWIGRVMSLHLSELQVMTVTPDYLKALQAGTEPTP